MIVEKQMQQVQGQLQLMELDKEMDVEPLGWFGLCLLHLRRKK
jgi:hypothetical protein